MPKLTHFALILSVMIILTIGCSGGGANPVLPGSDMQTSPPDGNIIPPADTSQPVIPDEVPRIPAQPENESTQQRVVWGVYNISFDPNTFEVTITPIRVGDKHYNVTSFITPPACPDCIGITIEGYNPEGWVYDILVSLKNPTAVTGYDVRGTLLVGDETDTRKLVNADEYTELFDPSTPPDRNPFKAFATDEPGRKFAPGKVHQVLYQISFPPPPKFNVLYVIDASFPGNQKEPFRIYDQAIDNPLDELGINSAEVVAYVQDWQGDVEFVKLDVTPLGAPASIDLVHQAGDMWSAMITNDWGATEGDYELWIETKSLDNAILLYDKLTLEVIVYENEPPVWLTTTGVQALTPLSQSMEVSFGVAVDINIPVTYNIYYSETTPIDFGSASSVNVPGAPGIVPSLDNSKTYYFAVRAMDGLLLEETNTVELSGCPNLPPEWDDTIGITSANPGDGEVEITYGTATDVDTPVTYIIYYSDTSPIDFGSASTVEDVDGSPITIDELTNGQEYYFAVRAKDSLDLEDTNIVELSATPDIGNQPPVWDDTVGAQSLTPLSQSMEVTFGTASDPDVPVTYNIYYSETTPIDFGSAASVNVAASPGVVPTLDNSKTYYFAVRAMDGLGLEETNIVELSGCPNLPPEWDDTIGITGTTYGDEQVEVTYGTASDVDAPVTYIVYYSDTTPINFATASTVEDAGGSPTVVDGLLNGQEYHFAVRAKDALDLEDTNTNELPATPSYTNEPPVWDDTIGVQSVTPLSEAMQVGFGTASDPDVPVTYNVYYSETTPIDFGTAASVNVAASPGVVPTLDNSKTYYFAVRAMDGLLLEETNTVELSGCPNLPPQWDTTTGVQSLTPLSESMQVEFGTASDPDLPVTYNVYYSETTPIDFGSAASENVASSPAVINTLDNSKTYYFAVRAEDGLGLEDDNTVELYGSPNLPPTWDSTIGVQELTPLSQMMRVDFGTASDPDTPVTYNVYYSETTLIDFGSAPSINVPSSPGVVPSLDNSKTYYFAVRAEDTHGLEETNTVELSGCPNLPPVWDSTVGATYAEPEDEQVTVSFGTATDPDVPVSYNVYYSDISPINFGTASKINAAASPVVISPLTNWQEYHFAVRAEDVYGLEDDNTIELSATPSPCISDDDPPDTFIDAGCEDQYKGTTEIKLTVSGADPDNCTSPEALVYEWRKKEQPDTWIDNWSPAVSGPNLTIDGLYDAYWDVQVRAVDEALNKDTTPAECSFAIVLWQPCEGSVHSSYGGDIYPQPCSVIPRTVGFVESEMGTFIGQALSQIGPTSIGMYNGGSAGSPIVGLKYGLYKTATVLNIDCGAVDERMLVVTEDAPHQLAVYDIKLILQSFPIIDAIDLDAGQSWVAVELDDNGDLWGIVRDTNDGITFELRHYAYLHVDDLYVDPAFNHTPLSTIDITAEVGTEDDIFDLVCLFELDKLYIYDANGGGSGGGGCVNIYDISGSPVWEDAVVDIFSSDLDYESVTATGGAIYGDIEIDHMDADDERCRILLYGRLTTGDAELYRLDHELNIVDSHVYNTAFPNMSINTDTPASLRNLIVPAGDHMGIMDAPMDW